MPVYLHLPPYIHAKIFILAYMHHHAYTCAYVHVYINT